MQCSQLVILIEISLILMLISKEFIAASNPRNESFNEGPGGFIQKIEISCKTRNRQKATSVNIQVHSLFKALLLEHCFWSKSTLASVLEGLDEQSVVELHVKFARNHMLSSSFFDRLTSLKYLHIQHNTIHSFPDEIFSGLHDLVELRIDWNRLESVTADLFQPTPKLRRLCMSNNELQDLPGGIFKYTPELRELEIRANNLDINLTRDVFKDVPLLTVLDVSNNKINHLSNDVFQDLSSLVNLSLNYNSIRSFPENLLWKNGKLRVLFLKKASAKNIDTLAENFLANSTELTMIDLEKNDLSKLPDGLFDHTTSLEKLYLGWNRLTSLNDVIFQKNTKLRELYLQDNRLNFIHKNSFSSLSELTTLILDTNQLSSLDPHIFSSLIHLNTLSLANNEVNMSGPLANVSNLYNCLKIENIDLKNNEVTQIYYDWRFKDVFLRVLDLSFNPISNIKEAITFISRKVRVNLSSNKYHKVNLLPSDQLEDSVNRKLYLNNEEFCPATCICSYRPMDQFFSLNCSGAKIFELPSKVPSLWFGSEPEELLLSNNNLTSLYQFSPWLNQQNISKLSLASNKLTNLDDLVVSPTLQILELHDNNLTNVDKKTIEKLNQTMNLTQITLHRNPWYCDCDSQYFLEYIQSHSKQIFNVSNVICINKGQPLIELSLSDICEYRYTFMAIIICISLASLGILCSILILLYYNYNQEIKVWMFAHRICLCLITEKEVDANKRFDAFVSYSHLDEAFVKEQLVPQLETGRNPYKLCLHYRDWLPGRLISNQIVLSVEQSRRTIIVLSPNFLNSDWGRLEFQQAHLKAIKERRARVIIILLEDIGDPDQLGPELKAYLTTNVYLRWDDPRFWQKLKYALPHQHSHQKAGNSLELQAITY